ncbi:TerC family protein [Vogesella indigofera]|uniref:Tellurite resistance protein TerC n=1 Tax=Vogesella indigofera TaxID=45465 RepID=A0A495BI25_VOGIN|nr:TerC family protein [Vogesella indigofera]RKQ59995.1 tellurite resistance protein TerC [Vogesella indigofera]
MEQALPSIGSPFFYAVFFVAVLLMIAVDMLALKQSGSHKVSIKEAGIWSAIWVGVACSFGGWLWWYLANDPAYGPAVANQKTLEYFTGYVIEKSLAVDNIFVFLLIFGFFKVPVEYQRRVLLYGVFGAIVLRTVMVFLGAALVKEFSWILYVFGAFLLFTGLKMMLPEKEEKEDLTNNALLRFLRRHMRITDDYHGEAFFVMKNGLRYATPMFLVLMMVELSDVVFAVDSIPAIFAVTMDPFIVLTSNIFAILGLRAMFFLLADVADRFHLLRYGLAIVLSFIGVKLLMLEFLHIPVAVSLGVVFVVIIGSVIASLLFPKKAA